MEAKMIHREKGVRTKDGAGVSLVRVLSNRTVTAYDPLLMLDSFDSTDPKDYIAGFPMHPHRGIETITYLRRGEITHEDSLGNKGRITDGGSQWMTAGSGIMHEEMPQPSDRMLGVQVWLNMPQKEKMAPPAYHDLSADKCPVVPVEGGEVAVIGGQYQGVQGFQGHHHPLTFLSIRLEAGGSLTLPLDPKGSQTVFLLEGDARLGDVVVEEKTAVRLAEGDSLTLKTTDGPIEVLFFESYPLEESIAWGGPIVMNTQEELDAAFAELREGSFIKDKPEGEA
ncbi:pirin family protein [Peptococcus simiae]|uniref:pirin family protein n=1 Tax=Peptococcus simiae TaxID=1643805 RepID=UPI00397F6BFE